MSDGQGQDCCFKHDATKDSMLRAGIVIGMDRVWEELARTAEEDCNATIPCGSCDACKMAKGLRLRKKIRALKMGGPPS